MSKLDRFLVSANFFHYWTDATVYALSRSISDHCPIMLKVGEVDYGPKPFKNFDLWLSIESFQHLVKSSWATGSFSGSGDVVFKEKIKRLKKNIKLWAKNELGSRCKNKDIILNALKSWDEKAESNSLAACDFQKREELLFELQQIEQNESLELKQKSRIKWSVEGDENSTFFHSYVNQKWRNSRMKGLIHNGDWQENPTVVKKIAKEHFASRFAEPLLKRPKFQSCRFKQLSQEDRDFLEAPFSVEEIKEAIWDCDGSKAPGPDGFNFNFIKKFWEVLKDSIFAAVKHFESSRKLARGCNSSFVALIPKKVDPLLISDFRPISLLGCLYKIIAKLLAKRLSRVLAKLISVNQSAFIKGRQIIDSVLIANELANYAKRKDLKLMMFKVDFEKAFDSVNWDFLISVMEQMGFGRKWCDWIKGCISSASISILVNGSPSDEFHMTRGLRQGDPLSPFLFLLVGEALQVMTMEACDKVFKAPECVLNKLEAIRRRFFWGMNENNKGIYWVAWKKIMASKEDGGLNIQSLKIKNLALLAKWHWRFINDGEALWKDLIVEFYGSDGQTRPNQLGSSVWNAILGVNDIIEHMGVGLNSTFLRTTANGSSSLFWDLKMNAAGPKLKHLFPRLYAQEVNKDSLFSERWRFIANSWTGNWCWRSDIRGRTLTEFNDMEELLRKMNFRESGADSWIWPLDANGVFTVSKLAKLLQRKTASSQGCDIQKIWNSSVPLKVNIFIWRMMFNALPTKINLQRRGIVLDSVDCVFCGLEEEDLDHCLFGCSKIDALWRKVWAWGGLPGQRIDSLLSFKNNLVSRDLGKNRNELIHAILLVTVWLIWQWRNKVAHSSQEEAGKVMQEDIFPSVQRLANFWIINRKPRLKACWQQCFALPLDW